MLDLGVLGLANPWLLTALISLPALWWLLRIIPPGAEADPLPRDPLPARARARGGNLGAHAALAPDHAPRGREPGDPGAGRTGAQSGAGAGRQGPAGAGGRRRLGGSARLGETHRDAGALRRARPAPEPRGGAARHRRRSGQAEAAAALRRRRGAHGRELEAQALAGRPRRRARAAQARAARRRRIDLA